MLMRNKPVDGETILQKSKKLTDYIGAKTRHFLETTKDRTKNLSSKANLSIKSAREAWKKEGVAVLRPNIDVSQATQHARKLMEGNVAGQKLLKLSQHKWFRKSIYGVSILVGLSMLEKMVSYDPKPAIPKHYERGYDLMNETMTDFGSPVKLIKTASKTITPYFSSGRKCLVTNTKAITNRNLSLALSNKAIGHTGY